MKLTTLVPGVDDDGQATPMTREVNVTFYDCGIALDLGRPSGFANDPDSARVYIEWREDRGWVAIMHNDDNDPVGRVFLKDDGTALFEED